MQFAVGIATTSDTAVSVLMIQMEAPRIRTLGGKDSTFRAPEDDMEDELAHAHALSPTVLVDLTRMPAALLLQGAHFIDLPGNLMPESWAYDVAAQGRCLVMFVSETLQRNVWASVRS